MWFELSNGKHTLTYLLQAITKQYINYLHHYFPSDINYGLWQWEWNIAAGKMYGFSVIDN